MPRKSALFIGVSASAMAFAFTHVFTEVHAVPLLWYYPLERRWAFGMAATGLAMGWYGRSLLATAVAVAVFAIAFWTSQRMSPATQLALHAWGICAAAAAVITMAAYSWQLAQRRPVPLPLPNECGIENCKGSLGDRGR